MYIERTIANGDLYSFREIALQNNVQPVDPYAKYHFYDL